MLNITSKLVKTSKDWQSFKGCQSSQTLFFIYHPDFILLTTPSQQKLVNKAQQILTYRNWVAHANPNRFHGREELQTIYRTLNDIINILLQY